MSIEVEKSAIGPPARRFAPGLRLGSSRQTSQVPGPELVEKVADRGQAVSANQEQMAGALAPLGYKARAPKDPQVVGDDLL